MSALDRAGFCQQLTVVDTPHELTLPGGNVVMVRPVGAKMLREYRRSLRDKDGKTLEDRKPFADDLLVARVLCNPDGSRMFTDEDVLSGAMDAVRATAMDALLEYTWEYVYDTTDAEDTEKKY